MKRLFLIALAITAPLALHADTVFSDTFVNGSTINSTPTAPTANSASYQNWTQGANPANPSAAGSLHFEARNTSSVFSEVQAQFTTTPVSLASVGDSVNLTLVFTDTAGVLLAGQNASSQLTIGLYNSFGVLPLQGTRIDSGSAQTGGAANYLGYIGRIMLNGNGVIFTRPAQAYNAGPPITGDLSRNQDLLFNNVGSGAFNSPTAAVVGSMAATGFTTGLTAGNQYTIDFQVLLSAASTLTITESLYSGNGTGGTLLATWNGAASGATYLTSSFDSLAFGWRRTGTATGISSLDVNSITVTSQIVPEPSSVMLFCGGIGLVALIRRFRR
jgi:hypothetical protein